MDLVTASVQIIRQHNQALEIMERVIVADMTTLGDPRLKHLLVGYLLGVRALRSDFENLEANLLHEALTVAEVERMMSIEAEPY